MKPNQDSLDNLRKTAASNPLRSSLFQWMAANYDLISDLVEGIARVNWDPIRIMAIQQGIRLRPDAELTVEHMWRTWPRVRKACLRGHPPDKRLPPETHRPQLPVTVTRTLEVEKQRDPVAPIPQRIASPAKEALSPEHNKVVATSSDQPVSDEMNTPAGKLAQEKMDRVMAELRKRSNENNGIF